MIDKQTSTIFYKIDHFGSIFLGYCGAAKTSALAGASLAFFTDIICAVYYYCPLLCLVVKAAVQSCQPERQSMFPKIGLAGEVETKAALKGRGPVGKSACIGLT